jgi:hypothetical protein
MQPESSRVIRKAMDALLATISRGITCPEIQEHADRLGQDIETFLFAADKEGNVSEYLELKGSTSGIFNPYTAIKNAGYQIVNSDEQTN